VRTAPSTFADITTSSSCSELQISCLRFAVVKQYFCLLALSPFVERHVQILEALYFQKVAFKVVYLQYQLTPDSESVQKVLVLNIYIASREDAAALGSNAMRNKTT
jgi:hypothetical protein